MGASNTKDSDDTEFYQLSPAGTFLDHLIIMASRFKLFWCAATMWSGGLISCLIVSLLWPHQKVLVAICHGDSADAKQRKTPPSTFPNPRCLYNRQSQIVRPPSPSNSPSWLCQKPIRKKPSINSIQLWSSCHACLLFKGEANFMPWFFQQTKSNKI